MKEMTFTTLAELKEFLNGLSEAELKANTNIHDEYFIELYWNANRSNHWYSIEGLIGGEE